MRISKKDIIFLNGHLSSVPAEECSVYFQLGYNEYVEDFLGELQILSNIYLDPMTEESCFDISEIQCNTSSLGRIILNLSDRKEFIKGTEKAEKVCFEYLVFTLDKGTNKPAA